MMHHHTQSCQRRNQIRVETKQQLERLQHSQPPQLSPPACQCCRRRCCNRILSSVRAGVVLHSHITFLMRDSGVANELVFESSWSQDFCCRLAMRRSHVAHGFVSSFLPDVKEMSHASLPARVTLMRERERCLPSPSSLVRLCVQRASQRVTQTPTPTNHNTSSGNRGRRGTRLVRSSLSTSKVVSYVRMVFV